MCFRDISAKFCLFMGLVKKISQTSYIMVCIRPWHIAKRERLALFKTCTFSFKWIIIKIYLRIAFEILHSMVNLIYHKNTLYPVLKFMFSKKATKIDEIFTVDLTLCSKCQIYGVDFVNCIGLLRKHTFSNGLSVD